MNLGEKLIENRAKMKEREWARSLTGSAKEAHEFFSSTFKNIKEHIQNGSTIDPICVPNYLDYKKNIAMNNGHNFWQVVNKFSIALEKEGLWAIVEEMPENDFNRHGEYDHYINIHPII